MMNEVILALQAQLQADVGANAVCGKVPTIYAGNVGTVAKFVLPAIIIQRGKTTVKRQSTTTDQYSFAVKILVVVDVAATMDVAGAPDRVVKSQQALTLLIEQGDSATGSPKTSTVLGSLNRQSNLRANQWAYNLTPEVNYEPSEPKDGWMCAAEITLANLTEMNQRLN